MGAATIITLGVAVTASAAALAIADEGSVAMSAAITAASVSIVAAIGSLTLAIHGHRKVNKSQCEEIELLKSENRGLRKRLADKLPPPKPTETK